MKRNIWIALAIAALAAPLGAQDKKPADATAGQGASTSTVELVFKTLDKDQDGFISRQEAKGSTIERDFSAVDKDRDGKLSLSEYAAARPAASGDSAKPKQ
jgi:hypothetical protein